MLRVVNFPLVDSIYRPIHDTIQLNINYMTIILLMKKQLLTVMVR